VALISRGLWGSCNTEGGEKSVNGERGRLFLRDEIKDKEARKLSGRNKKETNV
jgi:hypothetical protein